MKRLRQSITMAVSGLLLSGAVATAADTSQEAAVLTKQAVKLYKEGKEAESLALAVESVAQNPHDWLAHEVLAFLNWRQGKVMDAISEGRKAGELAPNQGIVFCNLGHANELLYRYGDAISAYNWARMKMPTYWVPWIGLVRSFVKNNNQKDGLAVLQYMETQSDRDLDWYYQVGQAYLNLDRPGLAVSPLSKAMRLASNPQQRSACATSRLLALLRDNQADRARAVASDVLKQYKPQSHELYVRAASLVPSNMNPNSGRIFLRLVANNLKSVADSDAYFRIGRIYEDKAIALAYDESVCRQWLANAEAAYRQAIELERDKAAYHRALAGVLDRQSNTSETEKELRTAESLDKGDKLAAYLLGTTSLALNAQNAGQKSATRPQSAYLCNLTEVTFRVDGLCACKINSVKPTLEKIPGVVLASTSSTTPLWGTVIVDRSQVALNNLFDRALNDLFDGKPPNKEPGHTHRVAFNVHSSRQIHTAADAIVLQRNKLGALFDFGKHEMAQGMPIPPFELAEVGDKRL